MILAVAIGNGAVRVAWIIPRTGEQLGHVMSTMMLCAAIWAVSWLLVGWLGVSTRGDAVRVGLAWLGLTVAFEFLAGHYLFGTPWRVLVADYNIPRGRIWILVLVTTASAPLLAASVRGVFGPVRRIYGDLLC